jgi:hypothetical protein
MFKIFRKSEEAKKAEAEKKAVEKKAPEKAIESLVVCAFASIGVLAVLGFLIAFSEDKKF